MKSLDNRDTGLDHRDVAALRRRIAQLAASYTPEWRFTTENPDIGSTIAMIFADQMAENLRGLQRLPEKYHTELTRLMGISLLPATPAEGIVVAEMASDTIPGVALPKGSRVVGRSLEGNPVVYETTGDLHITSAKLQDIVAIAPKLGKLLPIFAGPKPLALLPSEETAAALAQEDLGKPSQQEIPPFTLFDFSGDGIEKNALLIGHSSLLRGDEQITLSIHAMDENQCPLAAVLADPTRYRWSRATAAGFVPIEMVRADGDRLLLSQSQPSEPVEVAGQPTYLLCVEPCGAVTQAISLTDCSLSAESEAIPPSCVLHDNAELNGDEFAPFGESISLFDLCYIGCERLFVQEGATVEMKFHLENREKLMTFTPEQVDESLKIIKRKPRVVPQTTVRTAAERIRIEYHNGTGWKRLPLAQEVTSLFDGSHQGDFVLHFVCPEDWQPVTNGSYQERMLRLSVAQADNCFLQPCIHTTPLLKGLSFRFYYADGGKQPELLERITGATRYPLLSDYQKKQPVVAFSPLPYAGEGVYFGFDRRPESAPIGVLFEVVGSVLPNDAPLHFSYSTLRGFRPLKVVDHTDGLTRSGTLVFLPPADFAAVSIEGVKRHWICLTDDLSHQQKKDRYQPEVKRLLLNAAEVRNQETLEEELFYLEVPTPHMAFALAATDIYQADVFVNEFGSYSIAEMEEMERKSPETIKVQRDAAGNILAFLVRWEERENFDLSKAGDRHYLIDRQNNRILFGDGVHVQIPKAQQGIAFTVQVTRSDGAGGNLAAGEIRTLFRDVPYLSSVTNPIAAFGGSDLETPQDAQRRAAYLFSGRNRLVTVGDYEREIFACSDAVLQVKCLPGYDVWGRERAGMITIAMLLENFAEGAYAFASLQQRLKQRLLSRCETTVSEESLCLCEPFYIKISVSVWVSIEDITHSFSAKQELEETLTDYLSPLGSRQWKIGQLPTTASIERELHTLRIAGTILHHTVTASYVDLTGYHETTLEELPPHPLAIPINGEHRIFLEMEHAEERGSYAR